MSEIRDQVQDNSPPTRAVPLLDDGESPLIEGTILSADLSQTQYYSEQSAPTRLGRYVIEGFLGTGGFGLVYRARDEQLDRAVAIKVPHQHRVQTESDRLQYLSEARTVANLDHPGIVPVYDYGVLEDGRCFVVSKLIDGRNLAQVIAVNRPSLETSVEFMISVAETLNYVHCQKLIHRDIKPSNLLVDRENRIYVADFGLALHETDASQHLAGAGTPNYMSPEQAGREGHRIDSRTDLFSLGSAMYELLTGTRPFPGTTYEETIQKLLNDDPVPLTTHDPSMPAELNRICMKLLSKRSSVRYQSGQELASDLRHYQSPPVLGLAESHHLSQPPTSVSPETKGQVVPRGLRAYDRHDAYFFLQLLPGPFDREGLPESLSHWQRWVKHSEDLPELHRIGVIAGPSGCGKSSLIRAGLIPLLDKTVSSLIIEATVDRTETQLSSALDSRFPVLASEATLTDKLAAIRRGQGLPAGRKLLIVIDQFEQWLHSVHEREHPELIRALRQCDGQRIQCIVLVRDDFWLALNRFMEAVETPLVVGQNVKLVDLFDLPHARKVLTRFGRAYERIPTTLDTPSAETRRFIDQAVEYLSKDGKVFPVHLSLFAEMVKTRDWVPTTLQQLGGAVGVGVQFLRESFSAAHAPVGQRIHEDAARRVLDGLLPEVGTEIKTRHRTREELVALSGYGEDPKRFQSLMEILEGQLKLISPVDVMDHSRSSAESRVVELHYQYSHDFLVPSIREWLYSEQRKSYRGRCHLLLTEQTSAWVKQPVRRNLPLWRDWIQYRCLLRPSSLTVPERRFLKAANQQLGLQTLLGLCLMVLSIVGLQNYRNWSRGHALLDQLHTTSVASAPDIIHQMQPYRWYTTGALERAITAVQPGSSEELKLRLADVKWNPGSAQPLLQLALQSEDVESNLIVREALLPFAEQCRDECWKSVEEGLNSIATDARRQRAFRAVLLLAKLDLPEDQDSQERWKPVSEHLSEWTIQWVMSHPDDYRRLVDGMRPVAALLTPRFRDSLGKPESDRERSATRFLRDFHAGDSQVLTELSLISSPWQWEYLLPSRDKIAEEWLRDAMKSTALPVDELQRDHHLSTAAALLLSRSADSELWNMLKRSANPGTRSNLIDRIPLLQVELNAVEKQLSVQSDPGIVSGLLLTLGNYPGVQGRLAERTRQRIRELFETDPDSGVHSAAEWLMQHCQIPRNPTILITNGVTRKPEFQWRVTAEGHVMIRFDGRQTPGIGREFELCATEVTVKQYLTFSPHKHYKVLHAPTADCPINIVKWPEVIQYCNWLSKQHQLTTDQFCCPPSLTDDQLHDTFPDLTRSGYRPPSRAEWEFACRAGTQSRWYFGSDPDLLGRYEWFYDNSVIVDPHDRTMYSISHPVGLMKPNDFGIFDMYGNTREWCADGPSDNRFMRYVLGGSHQYNIENFENSSDSLTPTNTEFNSIGFRIARTVSDLEKASP